MSSASSLTIFLTLAIAAVRSAMYLIACGLCLWRRDLSGWIFGMAAGLAAFATVNACTVWEYSLYFTGAPRGTGPLDAESLFYYSLSVKTCGELVFVVSLAGTLNALADKFDFWNQIWSSEAAKGEAPLE